MKTKEEMMQRFCELMQKAIDSKDPKQMETLAESDKQMFKKLLSMNPDMADTWLNFYEAINWDNYLTEREAMNIGKRTMNQDGTTGFHWDYATFIATVKSLGGMPEHAPKYNTYALWVAANKQFSDHARSIAEDMGYKTPAEVTAEKMALSCYKKAVEELTDADKVFRIRSYYKDKMCDDSPM